MEKYLVEEIIACQHDERQFFYYFKDRYALLLLSYITHNGLKISALKNSDFARLLDKPIVKQALAQSGDGMVRSETLQSIWSEQTEPFLLTLSYWGGDPDRSWQQTCRKGYNLVLQLNFSQKHDEHYQRLLKPVDDDLFNCSAHPVRKPQQSFFRQTLAWARIDLDFQHEEVLIEEIQSDWVSYAQLLAQELSRYRNQYDSPLSHYGIRADKTSVLKYLQQVLKPYARLWDEAMLAAAIQFIREELGLQRIFYHEFQTGVALKDLRHYQPPRSLYTELPRRFCFQKTTEIPQFLRNDKVTRRVLKKVKSPCFYQLTI